VAGNGGLESPPSASQDGGAEPWLTLFEVIEDPEGSYWEGTVADGGMWRPWGPVPISSGRSAGSPHISGLQSPITTRLFPDRPVRGAQALWWYVGSRGTKGYFEPASVRRLLLRRSHICQHRTRQTNIVFDYGPSPRRAFWGASAQARGTDDPAALCPVLNVEALRCTGGAGTDQVQMAEA